MNLIREFFEYFDLSFTDKVFVPESGQVRPEGVGTCVLSRC